MQGVGRQAAGDKRRLGALGRCMLKSAVTLQEHERPVGVLSSSVHGRRIHQPVEPLDRDHQRVNHVQADFYRKNDIPSIKAPGFGHVSPA